MSKVVNKDKCYRGVVGKDGKIVWSARSITYNKETGLFKFYAVKNGTKVYKEDGKIDGSRLIEYVDGKSIGGYNNSFEFSISEKELLYVSLDSYASYQEMLEYIKPLVVLADTTNTIVPNADANVKSNPTPEITLIPQEGNTSKLNQSKSPTPRVTFSPDVVGYETSPNEPASSLPDTKRKSISLGEVIDSRRSGSIRSSINSTQVDSPVAGTPSISLQSKEAEIAAPILLDARKSITADTKAAAVSAPANTTASSTVAASNTTASTRPAVATPTSSDKKKKLLGAIVNLTKNSDNVDALMASVPTDNGPVPISTPVKLPMPTTSTVTSNTTESVQAKASVISSSAHSVGSDKSAPVSAPTSAAATTTKAQPAVAALTTPSTSDARKSITAATKAAAVSAPANTTASSTVAASNTTASTRPAVATPTSSDKKKKLLGAIVNLTKNSDNVDALMASVPTDNGPVPISTPVKLPMPTTSTVTSNTTESVQAKASVISAPTTTTASSTVAASNSKVSTQPAVATPSSGKKKTILGAIMNLTKSSSKVDALMASVPTDSDPVPMSTPVKLPVPIASSVASDDINADVNVSQIVLPYLKLARRIQLWYLTNTGNGAVDPEKLVSSLKNCKDKALQALSNGKLEHFDWNEVIEVLKAHESIPSNDEGSVGVVDNLDYFLELVVPGQPTHVTVVNTNDSCDATIAKVIESVRSSGTVVDVDSVLAATRRHLVSREKLLLQIQQMLLENLHDSQELILEAENVQGDMRDDIEALENKYVAKCDELSRSKILMDEIAISASQHVKELEEIIEGLRLELAENKKIARAVAASAEDHVNELEKQIEELCSENHELQHNMDMIALHVEEVESENHHLYMSMEEIKKQILEKQQNDAIELTRASRFAKLTELENQLAQAKAKETANELKIVELSQLLQIQRNMYIDDGRDSASSSIVESQLAACDREIELLRDVLNPTQTHLYQELKRNEEARTVMETELINSDIENEKLKKELEYYKTQCQELEFALKHRIQDDTVPTYQLNPPQAYPEVTESTADPSFSPDEMNLNSFSEGKSNDHWYGSSINDIDYDYTQQSFQYSPAASTPMARSSSSKQVEKQSITYIDPTAAKKKWNTESMPWNKKANTMNAISAAVTQRQKEREFVHINPDAKKVSINPLTGVAWVPKVARTNTWK